MQKRQNLYNYSFLEVEDWLKTRNESKFRAKQIWNWLYVIKVDEFSQMSNLPKSLIGALEDKFTINDLTLIDLDDGNDNVRAFWEYEINGKKQKFVTRAFATNYGCAATIAAQAEDETSEIINLSSGVMIEQLIKMEKLIPQFKKVSHINVRGINDVADNFENVLKFLKACNDEDGIKIGARNMQVTVVKVSDVARLLADFGLQINLVVDLVGVNDAVRLKIAGEGGQLEKVSEVISATRMYTQKTKRRVTYEYLLRLNKNDSNNDALALAELVRGLNVIVSLVVESSASNVVRNEFYRILNENKIQVTTKN